MRLFLGLGVSQTPDIASRIQQLQAKIQSKMGSLANQPAPPVPGLYEFYEERMRWLIGYFLFFD